MTVKTLTVRISFYLAGIALGTGIIVAPDVQAATLSPDYSGGTIPDFSAATFDSGSSTSDNPYFSLTPGTVYTYAGEKIDEDTGETEFENNQVFVTFETKEVFGVTSRVMRDTDYLNGLLVEDTNDWYAQDTDGNVWYMGEFSTSYEYDDEGNLIETSQSGSWEAGVNEALPGYIMTNPQVDDQYFQEFAPKDEAVDQARVIATNESISTGLGNFDNVLQTFEFTELDLAALEYKYYAPEIGLVRIEELDEEGEVVFSPELVSVESVSQSVPEPISVLGLLGVGLVGWKQRWRKVRVKPSLIVKQ